MADIITNMFCTVTVIHTTCILHDKNICIWTHKNAGKPGLTLCLANPDTMVCLKMEMTAVGQQHPGKGDRGQIVWVIGTPPLVHQ